MKKCTLAQVANAMVDFCTERLEKAEVSPETLKTDLVHRNCDVWIGLIANYCKVPRSCIPPQHVEDARSIILRAMKLKP